MEKAEEEEEAVEVVEEVERKKGHYTCMQRARKKEEGGYI